MSIGVLRLPLLVMIAAIVLLRRRIDMYRVDGTLRALQRAGLANAALAGPTFPL